MRTSDLEILIVPGGHRDFGADHWQTRWRLKLSTARLIEPPGSLRRQAAAWTEAIVAAVERAERPAVAIAHDLGVIAVVRAAARLDPGRLRGAFLVAPPSTATIRAIPDIDPSFAEIPHEPLPFPAVLIASRNDPLADFGESEDLSYAWGAALVDAGEAGHLDADSGHGPWPEGLMRFAGFIRRL